MDWIPAFAGMTEEVWWMLLYLCDAKSGSDALAVMLQIGKATIMVAIQAKQN